MAERPRPAIPTDKYHGRNLEGARIVPTFTWGNGAIRLAFHSEAEGPIRLVDLSSAESAPATAVPTSSPAQPLVEVLSPAYGRINNSTRYEGTLIGAGLRYRSHHEWSGHGRCGLTVEQYHARSGLVVVSSFEAGEGIPAVRVTTTLRLEGGHPPLQLWAVTSLATGAVLSSRINDLEVWSARTAWCAENRWSRTPLRAPGLVRIDPSARGETSRNTISATSFSTWSSGAMNPIGAVRDQTDGTTLAWQIEHNGAWHWEVGERPDWERGAVAIEHRVRAAEPYGPPAGDRSNDGAYLALLGPTDAFHHWSIVLEGGRSFTTVPATVTVASSLEDALGNLALHRRAARRPHPQNTALPVVFNDYMNTLEGDPTEAKLIPLIAAAARVGAEYFCIDAGWYDDTAGWWASVGDWVPSTERFPSGLQHVLDQIRSSGMVPGLWLEPEVVGETSRAAVALPDDAFLQRGGVRIREHQRYFLDLRSPAARAHIDDAVDRLVRELGIGYFKFDYNVTPGAGTDLRAESVGDGLLGHNRALLGWLAGVLDRHPDLILENCASGAMRSDFAMLGVLQLQSTSDQQDPLLYPAIAVGALAHILPEQAANWSYPQPDMDDEMIVFTMCTGLAGRLYQAGVLSKMDEHRLDLVADGVRVHKRTRAAIATSIPRFPTGLPDWNDPWVSVAFDAGDETYVLLWRQEHGERNIDLPLPHLQGVETDVEQIYPPPHIGAPWRVMVRAGRLHIESAGSGPSARMFRVAARARADAAPDGDLNDAPPTLPLAPRVGDRTP